MKLLRKSAALLAVLSLLLTLWAPVAVIAASDAQPKAVVASNDPLEAPVELLAKLDNGSVMCDVYLLVLDAIRNGEEWITLPLDTYPITAEETEIIVSVVNAVLPENYGNDIGHSYCYYGHDADYGEVTFYSWFYDWGLTEEMAEETDAVVAEMTADLAGKSDFEKSLILYERLIKHNSYNYSLYNQTAFGALIEQMSVCAGYARSYQALLQAVGIPCLYVSGMADNGYEIGGHAWNIVKLDGKWYYSDPTWDDYDDTFYHTFLQYFNITYDDISTDHFLDDIFEPWVPKEPAIDANYYYHEGTLCNNPTVEQLAELFQQQNPVILYVTENRQAVADFFFEHLYDIVEAMGMEYIQSATYALAGDYGLRLYLTLEHEHSYVSEVIPAACLTQGYTRYTCSACGNTYTEDIVDALGHDIVSYPAQTPTCMEMGWEAYEACTRCYYTTQVLEWGACQYEVVEVVEPDCYNDGYTLHRCSVCEHEYTDNHVPALDHTFSDAWEYNESYHWHACIRCGGRTDNALHEEAHHCTICGYGEVTVLPGDANEDGKVNNRDLGMLQRLLNDIEVTVNEKACDLNGDGKVNNRDLGLLQKLLNE